MSIRRLATTLLLPLVTLLSLPSQAFVGGIAVSLGRATNVEGADIPPFSATAQLETEEHQITSRVNFQPGMVRDEADAGGMPMITIQRFDKGKVWVLMGQNMYMETEIGEAEQAPDYTLVERTMEGTEVINGEETTKYKTIYEGPEGRFAGFTWFTKDNIAVKGFIVSETQGEKQRLKWTMTDVQRGEQPDELFELPPGAQKFAGMEHVMDMMRGGGAQGAPQTEDAEGQPANMEDAIKEGMKGLGTLFGN
jgi:hypothetical protein